MEPYGGYEVKTEGGKTKKKKLIFELFLKWCLI